MIVIVVVVVVLVVVVVVMMTAVAPVRIQLLFQLHGLRQVLLLYIA